MMGSLIPPIEVESRKPYRLSVSVSGSQVPLPESIYAAGRVTSGRRLIETMGPRGCSYSGICMLRVSNLV